MDMNVVHTEGASGAPAAPAPAGPALAAPAPPQPTLRERIPEKFHVMKGEEFDIEGTASKLADSYGQLESRMRGGDVAPKSADEYKITVPEQFAEHWAENEMTAAFKAEALEAGLTPAQFDFVMGKYFAIAPDLVSGALNSTTEGVVGELTTAWGEGPAYDKNLQAAHTAFEAYADPADRGKFDQMLSNPALAYRILAKIGPELGEARGVASAAETGVGDNINALLTSEANKNPKHPDHAATRARINAYYNQRYGTEQVT